MITEHAFNEKVRQSTGRPKDAAKRKGIVHAATTLFMKQGYELTSMEAIAKLADVSKLTIYSHFANKMELFKEVIMQRCDKLAAPESFMNFAKLPVKQALLQLGGILARLIFSPDSVHLLRIMQSEAMHHPQIVKVFYQSGPQRVKEAFGELLKEWHRQGQLSVPDIGTATEQFFSLLKGEAHVKVMMLLAPNLSADEMDAHVQATVQLFLATYLSKTGSSA